MRSCSFNVINEHAPHFPDQFRDAYMKKWKEKQEAGNIVKASKTRQENFSDGKCVSGIGLTGESSTCYSGGDVRHAPGRDPQGWRSPLPSTA